MGLYFLGSWYIGMLLAAPLWLGYSGHSAWWVLAPAYGISTVTNLTTRFAVTYNQLVTAKHEGNLGRALFYNFVLSGLIFVPVLLLPYALGRWLAP